MNPQETIVLLSGCYTFNSFCGIPHPPTRWGSSSLGEFIESLELCNPEADGRFDFGYFKPSTFASYRGFNNHLAFINNIKGIV